MLLVFWVITPLQGAIFGTGPVQLHQPASFYASSDLMPIEDQATATDTSILQKMYGIKYLNQEYPPYTSAEYALRPFNLESESRPGTQNWTATTTKLWTDLECWPAEWELSNPHTGYFDFNNGQGCNASGIQAVSSSGSLKPRMHYLAWYNSAWATQSLQRIPHCPQEFSHQFLAITANERPDNVTMTALFCEAKYYKQKVRVSIAGDTFHPNNASLEELGPVEELPGTEFNATGFEHVLGASVSEVQGATRDYPHNILVDQAEKVRYLDLALPVSPLVGYAVGGGSRKFDDYYDEDVLADAYRGVHKALFSIAYSSLLTNATASNATEEGSVDIALHGIIVSRLFSGLVEGFLIAVSASSILLVVLSSKTKSSLSGDPATLGDLIYILQNSPELVKATCYTEPQEGGVDQGEEEPRLHLRCGCQEADGEMAIQVAGLSRPISLSAKPGAKGEPDTRKSSMSKPLALRRSVGSAFTLALIAAFIGLLYLRQQEQKLGGKLFLVPQVLPFLHSTNKHAGLIRPSENFEVLQLLESYIPTAIATAIEPYWVLLNRLLGIVQPFRDLWKGKGKDQYRRVIRARYSSLPPQMSIWGALRSGHFLLAVVCFIALLSNILAVGLGGLFKEESTQVAYPVNLEYLQSEEFDVQMEYLVPRVPVQHANFFGIQANLSSGVLLPPWVTDEYYFQPFGERGGLQNNHTESLRGRTRGYGLNITCDEVQQLAPPDKLDKLDMRPFKQKHGIPNELCEDFYNRTIYRDQTGAVAVEGAISTCYNALLLYWGRTTQDPPGDDLEIRYFACYPELKTALFDVSVDAEGHVLKHERVTEFGSELSYPQANNHTRLILDLTRATMSIGVASPTWHNDTISRGWIWDTLKLLGHGNFLDPQEPNPDPEEILPLIYDIWHRSFAFSLGSKDIVPYAPADQEPFEGTMRVRETRIFMSDSAFIISAVILAVNIVVAAAIFGFSVSWFLPRMPTTVAAILEFMGPSRALAGYSPKSGALLGFGGYIGRDGKKHVGIEFKELVVPERAGSKIGGRAAGGIRRRWFGRKPDPPLGGGGETAV